MEPWLERFAQANFRRSADTAHDLKTPLNVAVLNLELLRMRLRRIGADADDKAAEHTRAVEVELRRMARIFDAFFLLSTPPRGRSPQPVDAAALWRDAAEDAGFPRVGEGQPMIQGDPERFREMFRLIFDAAGRDLRPDGREAAQEETPSELILTVAGSRADGLELEKAFKFYYTDREGNPDLSLAVARLIAETYGGDLTSMEDGEKVVFRLSLPLGER